MTMRCLAEFGQSPRLSGQPGCWRSSELLELPSVNFATAGPRTRMNSFLKCAKGFSALGIIAGEFSKFSCACEGEVHKKEVEAAKAYVDAEDWVAFRTSDEAQELVSTRSVPVRRATA